MKSANDIRRFLWPQPRRLRTTTARVALPITPTMPVDAGSWTEAAACAAIMLRPSKHVLCTPPPTPVSRPQQSDYRVTIEKQNSIYGADWYTLRLKADRAEICANHLAGVRNACATLRQLVAIDAPTIPALSIEDWPDFPVRGVMIDISRDRVPTQATLKALIELFAGWKYNQVQLYMEHTFRYQGHERVWRGSSALSPAEVRDLDEFCRLLGIELVPNQNSLGHMERWLKHEPYRQLSETLEPWETPWGEIRSRPTTLCPTDAGSIRLMRDLYEQLLPNFNSRQFNVGCDEPWELGQGRSKRACAKKGQGRVYLDYLKKLDKLVRGHGRRMQFWSDWLLRNPELVSELPDDMIPLVWGYEADHPYEKECEYMRRCGLEFYVCPGTSSWCSVSGRTENMLANIRHAAASGRRHGANGLLMTDWGDFGHHQVLPVSLPGFAWGAAQSWCAAQHRNAKPLGPMLDREVFGGEAGVGDAWIEAGRVHQKARKKIHNRSIFFSMLIDGVQFDPVKKPPTRQRIDAMLAAIDDLSKYAKQMRSVDRVLADEWKLTLMVMRHTCERCLHRSHLPANPTSASQKRAATKLKKGMQSIIDLHQAVWLQRNRRGGLKDSTARYLAVMKTYE